MASVREQILQAVMAKLEAVRAALDWADCIRNPRDEIGEDQMNAIILLDGAMDDPRGLSGGVGEESLEFSVGLLVRESGALSAEALIDAGYVAVKDALLDPADIQLGGLAEGVWAMGASEPVYGRAAKGARFLGGMVMDFSVKYLEREGDASSVGP